jgi:predicted Zn-dependent protease
LRFWDTGRKTLYFNTYYHKEGAVRISWHEFGHAIGFRHTHNKTKNFMSYYATSAYRKDVKYKLSSEQKRFLLKAYEKPFYDGWFD